MDREGILGRWQAQLDAIKGLGGKTDELIVDEPASEAEVARVEEELGLTLPPMMRNSFLKFARSVSVGWQLPDGFSLPEPVEEVTWGEIEYSLGGVVEAERLRCDWADDVIASWEIPESTALWENKIGFLAMECGDFLAVDIAKPGREPVVYLSHGGDEDMDDYALGVDFNDFLTRWTGVGCPATDSRTIAPFTHDFTKPLDPDCENAVLWRKALGLS